MTFFKHMGEGPVWIILASDGVDGCKRDWWSHFLFISNIYPWDEFNRCLPSLWYVSSEIQFFIFLPIQCWIYIRNRHAGIALSVFILLSSMASGFVLTDLYDISISRVGDQNYLNYLYVKPFTRIGAYQVGIIFGMFYFEWKNQKESNKFSNTIGSLFFQKVKNSRIFRYMIMIIGLAVMCVLIILPQVEIKNRYIDATYFSRMFNNFFNALSRPSFITALIFVIASPLTGHNIFLKVVLGSTGYVPWSRLTYVAFLLQVTIYQFYYYQTRQGAFLSHRPVMWVVMACVFLTFLISILFSIAFEVPFQQLEKLLMLPREYEESKQTFEAMRLRNKTFEKSTTEEDTCKW